MHIEIYSMCLLDYSVRHFEPFPCLVMSRNIFELLGVLENPVNFFFTVC